MAKAESVQKRLTRVRPPRVQMTYDVEIGDTLENKELPFVVGVVGDFGGNPDADKTRLKDRLFVGIDVENFDEVMSGIDPVARFTAPNMLSGDDSSIGVELHFKSLADFRPESVVRQVAPLAKLLDARGKLADLRNKLAGNDRLEDILGEVLGNTDQLAALKSAQAGKGE